MVPETVKVLTALLLSALAWMALLLSAMLELLTPATSATTSPRAVALASLLALCELTSPTDVPKVLVNVLANLLVALLLLACAAMVLLFRLKAEPATVPALSRTAYGSVSNSAGTALVVAVTEVPKAVW